MAGLEDLYREIILDHYRSPRNRGELEVPPATMAEGFNPLCGDEIRVFLQVDDAMISDVRIGGQGCSISQSSASMMSTAVLGTSIDEARDGLRQFKETTSIPAPGPGGRRDRPHHALRHGRPARVVVVVVARGHARPESAVHERPPPHQRARQFARDDRARAGVAPSLIHT